jgi:hypothetical protein
MCKAAANSKCVIVGATAVPTNAKAVYLTVSVWAAGNTVDLTPLFAGDFKI